MHRKPEADLLPLDIEIERTLKIWANQRESLQAILEEEEEAERLQRPNTMEDFWMPII